MLYWIFWKWEFSYLKLLSQVFGNSDKKWNGNLLNMVRFLNFLVTKFYCSCIYYYQIFIPESSLAWAMYLRPSFKTSDKTNNYFTLILVFYFSFYFFFSFLKNNKRKFHWSVNKLVSSRSNFLTSHSLFSQDKRSQQIFFLLEYYFQI